MPAPAVPVVADCSNLDRTLHVTSDLQVEFALHS